MGFTVVRMMVTLHDGPATSSEYSHFKSTKMVLKQHNFMGGKKEKQPKDKITQERPHFSVCSFMTGN